MNVQDLIPLTQNNKSNNSKKISRKENKNSIKRRIRKWFLFEVIFALLPLMSYIIVRYINGVEISLEECIPELLFFTIMICANCLCVVSDMKNSKEEGFFEAFFVSLVILIVIAAVLYGGLQVQNIKDNIIIQRTYTFSVMIAIASAMLGLLVQIKSVREEDLC